MRDPPLLEDLREVSQLLVRQDLQLREFGAGRGQRRCGIGRGVGTSVRGRGRSGGGRYGSLCLGGRCGIAMCVLVGTMLPRVRGK